MKSWSGSGPNRPMRYSPGVLGIVQLRVRPSSASSAAHQSTWLLPLNTEPEASKPYWLSRSMVQWQYLSEGMHTSVECGEEIPFNSQEAIAAQSAGVAPGLRRLFDFQTTGLWALCDAWGVQQAPGIADEPVVSAVPTLVLAGDYDPITPPAWGRLAAETLSNSFYVEFPGVGHGVYTARACAREIVEGFLETPTTAPDTGCVAELRVGFIVR